VLAIAVGVLAGAGADPTGAGGAGAAWVAGVGVTGSVGVSEAGAAGGAGLGEAGGGADVCPVESPDPSAGGVALDAAAGTARDRSVTAANATRCPLARRQSNDACVLPTPSDATIG
jgi:hypothetical protein